MQNFSIPPGSLNNLINKLNCKYMETHWSFGGCSYAETKNACAP